MRLYESSFHKGSSIEIHSIFDEDKEALPTGTSSERINSPMYIHIPLLKDGAKTCAAWLIKKHSRATLTAVNGLSPVIILHATWAVRSCWMAGAVPGFNLFSKMIRPRKRNPDSACSLQIMGP